jgi:hypothetical protein
MARIACSVHANDQDPSIDCAGCIKAERDFLLLEVTSLIKCLETPASKNHEDAKAFVAKLTDRGVTSLADAAVVYHLALLIGKVRSEPRTRG